jgi:AcrR family transcriptional regulator
MRHMHKAFESEAGHAGPLVPLPRGRHKLSLEAVRASQRQRLMTAMLESVAEDGYEATTVPRVVARARVSRNAFYELFADKLDCFLVLCDELSDQLLEASFGPVDVEHWLAAVRYGTVRYLAWWKARPLFARAYLVELPSAGTRAIEQRGRAYEQFGQQFATVAQWARSQDPGLAPLRPNGPLFLVWAITELVTARVAAGRTDQLPDLEDEIVWLVERILAERSS